MGIFKRDKPAPATEERSISTWVPFNMGPGVDGNVTERTALSLVPVYAAVRLLSDNISTLPLDSFRAMPNGVNVSAPVPALLRKPSAVGTLSDWLRRMVVSMALHGNAYGLVTSRDGFGFPSTIEWLDPNRVTVDESTPMSPKYFYMGRPVSNEDIVHVALFAVPGKVCGLSPIEAARRAINTGAAASAYGNQWFSSGGTPPGTFKNTAQTVTQDQSREISDRLTESLKSGKTLVYGSDWDYNPIAIPPEQAQFIETSRLTATQIANIYGIPPLFIGGDPGGGLTYNTPQMNSEQLVHFTLRPWLEHIEAAISALLPNSVFVEFNTTELLIPDPLKRAQADQIDRNAGIRSVNEIRADRGLPPIGPEGDVYTPNTAPPTVQMLPPPEPKAPEPPPEEPQQ